MKVGQSKTEYVCARERNLVEEMVAFQVLGVNSPEHQRLETR